MAKMSLHVGPDKLREHVAVEMRMDDKPLGHIFLDGASAEKHIHDVAKARAALTDPVPPDLDPVIIVEAQLNPVWRTPNYRIPQGRMLMLRHPGLGWLTFILPEAEAASIAEWLTKDLPVESEDAKR